MLVAQMTGEANHVLYYEAGEVPIQKQVQVPMFHTGCSPLDAVSRVEETGALIHHKADRC